MKKYAEVTLIGEELTRNERSEQVAVQTKTSVIGTLSGVTASEFYQAANSGYRPEIVVTIYEQEYAQQRRIRVGDVVYTVIRTYLSGDYIELHCQQKGADEDG